MPRNDTHRNFEHAFTLVELAVVLVIIGLIVGGVLVGRDLIHSSELQSIINERQRYSAAVNTFREKYGSYPGDIRNGFQYFSVACGDNTNNLNTGCNGNGDGIINTYYLAPPNPNYGEEFKVWQHLSLAQLISGNYDGQSTNMVVAQNNSPQPTLKDSFWHLGNFAADAGIYSYAGAARLDKAPPNKHYLRLGGTNPAGGLRNSPSLSNEDALRIDSKTDDGFSFTGAVLGRWEEGQCYDANSDGSHALTLDADFRVYPNPNPADPYSLKAVGANNVGNCILTFILD